MKWICFNKSQELETWHFWFAWHPVCIGKYPDGSLKMIWLEPLQRCGTFRYSYHDDGNWDWQYRELNN